MREYVFGFVQFVMEFVHCDGFRGTVPHPPKHGSPGATLSLEPIHA